MQLKTLFSFYNKESQKGFTIIEIVIVTGLIIMLSTLAIINFDPIGNKKKARDEKRISDITTIDRAVSEFMVDKRRYPDQIDILRKSTILPAGSTQLTSSNKGWIQENLSSYVPMLPIDSLNDATYYYSYIHNLTSYEINAKLEVLTDEMVNDGGNDDTLYEIGNNLTLISP